MKAVNFCVGKNPWNKFAGKKIINDVVILNSYDKYHNIEQIKPLFLANKLFLNWCHDDFIKECVISEIFPHVREIVVRSSKNGPLIIKQHYGISEIYTPFDCVQIRSSGPIKWNFGFLPENITVLTRKEHAEKLVSHKMIDPIILNI